MQESARLNEGNEAHFRKTVDEAFRELPEKLGIPETDIGSWEQIEKQIKEGYADAVYGTAVVEYKAPGLLRDNNSFSVNQKAIEQTRGYLKDMEDLYNWPPSMLTGLITDGYKIITVPVGREATRPVPSTASNLLPFLRRFRLLSQTEPFNAERIKDYFGKESKLTRSVVKSLFEAFQSSSSDQTKTYYNQWKYMFSVSHGSTGKRYLKALEESTGVSIDTKEEAMELLFCLYTYVVLVVKMIATNLVSYYSGIELLTTRLVGAEGEDLQKEFAKFEKGEIFEKVGIKNFAEGNFFSWYVYEWKKFNDDMTNLVETIGKFNPKSLTTNPEDTHDLLKGLYQDLIPRKLRHKLGEFYTPDWLAERTLNLTKYNGNPKERVLDPGCGSGTFLVEAIKRVRSYVYEKNNSLSLEDRASVGKDILKNIVGYDLNPVAVLAARTNYILSMGGIFQALIEKGETIDLPIYLCDSILTPRLQAQLSLGLDVKEITSSKFPTASDYSTKVYEIHTTEGSFPMPVKTVEKNEVQELTNKIEKGVKDFWSTEKFWEVTSKALFTADSESKQLIIDLYEDIKRLAEQKRDDIWPRILKNGFAQVMQERFDYVVGNPPWVNWENLPSDWRDSSRILWEKYGLFTLSGYEQLLGGAKPDISMLFTYTSADNYLKPEGELSFVITQSLFKSDAGEGFRRFQLGNKEYLSVKQVEDFVEVKPFKGASNRTAILALEKGEETNYPVPYKYWKRTRHRRIPENISLKEVKENWAKKIDFSAQPVNETVNTSPWLSGRKKALTALRKIIGDSDYNARAGSCTWLNGAYWIEVLEEKQNGNIRIRNLHDIGRKEVPQVEMVIEPDLVYPMLRGREVTRWKSNPQHNIIVPQEMSEGAGGYDKEKLKKNWPLTYKYFKKLEALLKERSGFKQFFNTEEDPFYSLYNIGPYTIKPYKVAWKYVAQDLTCSVFGHENENDNKLIIPDCKLMFVGCEKRYEAHYLSALLNSTVSRLLVKSYTIGTQISTHVLDNVAIPEFNNEDETHQHLAKLSIEAHKATKNKETNRLGEIEQNINQTAAAFWGIEDEQLIDINESLDELL